jgi:hypothetical protein
VVQKWNALLTMECIMIYNKRDKGEKTANQKEM